MNTLWDDPDSRDIVVSRAELYAHGDCGRDCDGPDPQPLGIGVLDVLVLDSLSVTIAALVARPKIGGNYIEFDVPTDDARRLALLLSKAADDAEATR
jgi:hypothetical protein